MKEMYFSIDIETLGFIAGMHPMISLGAVAFDINTGEEFGTFHMNLNSLVAGMYPDKDTEEWWKQFPEQYKEATINPKSVSEVVGTFWGWVNAIALGKKMVFAYWRSEFDGSFIRYYLERYLGLGNDKKMYSSMDIKTMAALALGKDISDLHSSDFPETWVGANNHTHNALEDAQQQKIICVNSFKLINGAINYYL